MPNHMKRYVKAKTHLKIPGWNMIVIHYCDYTKLSWTFDQPGI